MRSTGWRGWSRPARIRSTSRGGWCASRRRTSATPIRRRSTVAVAAKDAVHFIGMPEGNTALAQAAIYLATAPKSNAVYEAYSRAAEDAHSDVAQPVPLHLRNAPTKLMKELDYGKGYQLRARRGRRRRRHVVPARRRSRSGSTTSRPSAGSRRRSSDGSTAGRRSRKTAEVSSARAGRVAATSSRDDRRSGVKLPRIRPERRRRVRGRRSAYPR